MMYNIFTTIDQDEGGFVATHKKYEFINQSTSILSHISVDYPEKSLLILSFDQRWPTKVGPRACRNKMNQIIINGSVWPGLG